MRTKKTYIILIAILLVFFIIMFLIFGFENLRQEKYATTIIVGNDAIFNYKNKKWIKVVDKDLYNWKKFHVFSDNVEQGNYYLWHSDKWYIFDDKKEAIVLDGEMLAYKANYDISVGEFKKQSISDYSYLHEILNEYDLPTVEESANNYEVLFDYDNDGVEEEFYVVSNVFSNSSNKAFSFVFMVDDEKIYPIYKDVVENKSFNGCKPYFNSFLDVDNSGKYEFILSCAKYSVGKNKVMLYGMKKDEFKTLISNE